MNIVERLRDGYPGRYDAHLILMWSDVITDDAADEIERLQAENAALREALRYYANDMGYDGKIARTALEATK